ncbi:MAG: 1-deoxy-D-xylulose-5-phosphate reductoisomerase [Candidatus Omnitrophica bacterium]|nr:1-deoxy-D-xylulose-5-phosphate reductoisomerase [Candidatus Omnitrophota bacterium]MDD5430249.1 1-deoxy-D-xylulose-5-phosphate reductoisomerase [Candidatus Omnitrophota bacterium]
MKKVLIFGSTGSIGENALRLLRKQSKTFEVLGLCANRNVSALYRQVKEFRPKYVCVGDEKKAGELYKRIGKKAVIFSGPAGLREFSSIKSDISLMAISGICCLEPLLINIKHTSRIALANKESVVTAGNMVFKEAFKHNTEILPVDSEINALFQILGHGKAANESTADIRSVYLTASGGALAGYRRNQLDKVSVGKVLAHPNWRMGKRITIDSATLINKGFEVAETRYFFNLEYEQIKVVIHKESLVHALVEYEDGSTQACLYPPDMKIPISFALFYPERFKSSEFSVFKKEISCNFRPLKTNEYPLFDVVIEAAKKEDNALVVLNACDEVVIDNFLEKKIKFLDMEKIIKSIMRNCPRSRVKTFKDVLYWDNWSRLKTKERLDRL